MAEINVVPYIDVMLVLLVIFMITAPLLTEGVQVDLVEAVAKPVTSETPDPFVVTVDREGRYFVNEGKQTVSLKEVGRRARVVLKRAPRTEFLVRGDRRVPYEKVVQAMVALQEAGVESVGLVTEPPGR